MMYILYKCHGFLETVKKQKIQETYLFPQMYYKNKRCNDVIRSLRKRVSIPKKKYPWLLQE